jgi:hypothetical protein
MQVPRLRYASLGMTILLNNPHPPQIWCREFQTQQSRPLHASPHRDIHRVLHIDVEIGEEPESKPMALPVKAVTTRES